MPSSTWTVTGTSNNSEVSDITAIHYDADGNVDFTFSSRLKIGAEEDVDKFVVLAKENLILANGIQEDVRAFAGSIEEQLNS